MLCPAEGLVLHVEPCPAGYPSIGYGHKLTPAELAVGAYAEGITKQEAQDMLDEDISVARAAVLRHVKGLNENQLDALTCLCFNVGEGVFLGEAPKMTAALLAGDWATAAHEMLDIDKITIRHTDGRKSLLALSCLTNRRRTEAALFLSPVDGIDPAEVMASVGVSLEAMRWELDVLSPTSRDRDG